MHTSGEDGYDVASAAPPLGDVHRPDDHGIPRDVTDDSPRATSNANASPVDEGVAGLGGVLANSCQYLKQKNRAARASGKRLVRWKTTPFEFEPTPPPPLVRFILRALRCDTTLSKAVA